jgi:hypothetical protein
MKQQLYFSGLSTLVTTSFASSIFYRRIQKNLAMKFTEEGVYEVVTNTKLYPAL